MNSNKTKNAIIMKLWELAKELLFIYFVFPVKTLVALDFHHQKYYEKDNNSFSIRLSPSNFIG